MELEPLLNLLLKVHCLFYCRVIRRLEMKPISEQKVEKLSASTFQNRMLPAGLSI